MKLDVLKIANTGRTALFVASNNQNKGQVNERGGRWYAQPSPVLCPRMPEKKIFGLPVL